MKNMIRFIFNENVVRVWLSLIIFGTLTLLFGCSPRYTGLYQSVTTACEQICGHEWGGLVEIKPDAIYCECR